MGNRYGAVPTTLTLRASLGPVFAGRPCTHDDAGAHNTPPSSAVPTSVQCGFFHVRFGWVTGPAARLRCRG
eukprot:8582669-Pyramimonas_sp.AAC.1